MSTTTPGASPTMFTVNRYIGRKEARTRKGAAEAAAGSAHQQDGRGEGTGRGGKASFRTSFPAAVRAAAEELEGVVRHLEAEAPADVRLDPREVARHRRERLDPPAVAAHDPVAVDAVRRRSRTVGSFRGAPRSARGPGRKAARGSGRRWRRRAWAPGIVRGCRAGESGSGASSRIRRISSRPRVAVLPICRSCSECFPIAPPYLQIYCKCEYVASGFRRESASRPGTSELKFE